MLIEGELQSRSLKNGTGSNNNVVEIKAKRIQFLNRQEEDSVSPRSFGEMDSEKNDVIVEHELEEIGYDHYYNGEY